MKTDKQEVYIQMYLSGHFSCMEGETGRGGKGSDGGYPMPPLGDACSVECRVQTSVE